MLLLFTQLTVASSAACIKPKMADFLDLESWNQLSAIIQASEFEELPNSNQPVQQISQNTNNPQQNKEKSRFEVVDQAKIENFIEDQENVNTKRKTMADMKLFRQFCSEQNENEMPETFEVGKLDLLF